MNLTVGKVYAVFSEAGASATLHNGAVLEFPAGQPVTLVAQQATLELDGHAVVREIPNGNAVLLGEMMAKAQKWVQDLRAELAAMLDGTQFEVFWQASQNKLIVHTDRADDTQLEQVAALLERVLPQNIEVVRYNHDISYDWREYPMPMGYDIVEYLEASGGSIINTGLYPSSDVQLIAKAGKVNDNTVSFVCGANTYYDNGTYCGIIILNRLSTKKNQRVNLGGVFIDKIVVDDFLPHVWEVKNKAAYIDGQLFGTFEEARDEQSTAPIGLFCQQNNSRHNKPGAGHYDGGYNSRIWSFKATSLGQSVDMVPALDETGAPCMYDLVSRTPFYNAGTGDFLYPTETATYALRRVLPDWGKLTPTGLRRLYHAPAGYKGELIDYALENGYKPIVETEQPADGYWTPEWRETEEEIVLEWVETEPPAEEELSS